MPTLADYREEMLALGPADMGAVYPITGLTTTTVVSSSLATGGFSAERWVHYYILRREAASQPADRVRRCTAFTSSTGTLTHAGANYADTTITSEEVELWRYDPKDVDNAINEGIERIKRLQMVEIPSVAGNRYSLHALDWIDGAEDIERIEYSSSKQLSRNRFFDHYNTRNSSGVLQPDFWTIAGASGTMARSTTQLNGRSKYSLAITRAGTNVTVTQSVGLLRNGVDADSLAGQTVTAVLVGWSTDASQLRVQIDDGVTTSSSDYHTGDETWQELTIEKTLSSSATKCDVIITNDGTDSTAYAGECYLVYGSITDTERRNDFQTHRIWSKSMEQGVSFPIRLPSIGRGSSYHIYTRRPYAAFTDSRIIGGTADADECDAPREIVALGALWLLFEKLGRHTDVDNQENALKRGIAADYRRRFERMARQHLVESGAEHGALPTRQRLWAAPVRSGGWA